MKFSVKTAGNILLAAAVMFTFPICDAAANDGQAVSAAVKQTERVYQNMGLKLSIPGIYDRLLVVEKPNFNDKGIFFTVSEKASLDAAKALGENVDGAGRLFSIGVISEIQLYDMLQRDMSGAEVFAQDDNGLYYVYYHPTDVRLVRDDINNAQDIKQWTTLNEWAYTEVRDSFIADNSTVLNPVTFSNTDLSMYLARAAFMDGAKYTVSTSECCPEYPTVVNPLPYAMRLMRNTWAEAIDSAQAPEGDYVVLNFPEDKYRFDFFLADGSENIYRQTWNGNEQLFRMHFADGTTKASVVMKEWFDALAGAESMQALGYKPDDLKGTWAEKIAGRGTITVTTGAKGMYDVRIAWADSASKQHVWEMTARPTGEGGALFYDNATHIILTFTGDGESTDAVQYKNGTGKFYLNSAYELMWVDNVEGAGNNTVFIKAK